MGVGVYYRAEVPKRGLLRRVLPAQELWQEVSEESRALLMQSGNPLVELFWARPQGLNLWVSLVPFEENVEFEMRGEQVIVSAKTSGAGPGYHQLVVALLDRLEKEVGLHWMADAEEGEGDETGYRENRDIDSLRAAMVHQLQGVARYLTKGELSGVLLNMDISENPVQRGFACSPMGEWSEDWVRRLADADDNDALRYAAEFYPWWARELRAQELANFGRALCWTAVRWVAPGNAQEAQFIETALRCFERAEQVGEADSYSAEMRELRNLLTDGLEDEPPSPEGVGYRRRDIDYALPGGWTLTIPGYFHQETEDDGGTQVYWFGGRTIRVSTLRFDASKSPDEVLDTALPERGRELMTGLRGDLVGARETKWDESEGHFLTHVALVSDGSLFSLTCAHDDEDDVEWVREVARTARHARPQQR